MEEHALVAVGDTHQVGHLGGRQSLDVAEQDDLSLRLVQLREQLDHTSGEVLGHDPVVGAIRPELGRIDPRASGVEPFDVALVVWPSGALLLRRGGPRPIQQDPEQPRLQRRAPFEPLDAANDGEPRVLHDLFRDGVTANGRVGEAQELRLMAPHHLRECLVVARLETSTLGYYWGTGQQALRTDANGQTTYWHFYEAFNRHTSAAFANGEWTRVQYNSTNTQIDTYTGTTNTS